MAPLTAAMLTVSAAILAIAALWHVYWAAGGRRGLAMAVPERRAPATPLFVPRRWLTLAVAFAIAVIAAVYLGVAYSGWPICRRRRWQGRSRRRCLGLVFIARAIGDFGYVGFFKRYGGTAFARADTRCYSPLCLFLGISGLLPLALTALNVIG